MFAQVSFIIPLFNGLEFTQAMLASLRATLPAGLAHEIILVDNGSTDGTRKWLKTLGGAPFRVVFNDANLGYAAANNRAGRQAQGEWLFLLNNDLVFLPGWVEPMRELAARRGIGVVGNIQLSVRSREIDHAGVFFDKNGRPFHFRPAPIVLKNNAVIEAPAVTGACMLLRRALFNELEGFDENYVNGYEDLDLCLRLRSRGLRTAVATRSAAYHHIGASEGRHEREESNAARFHGRWDEFIGKLSGGEPPSTDAGESATRADEFPFDINAFATLQAFHPGPGGHSEPTSSAHLYPTGSWATVSVPLPEGIVRDGMALRLDPCNFPATIRVASLGFREINSSRLVWTVRPGELPGVMHVAGAAAVKVEGDRWLTLESSGNDPQLRLSAAPIPSELARRTDLMIEIRLQTIPLPK